jgi:hypothetical protein
MTKEDNHRTKERLRSAAYYRANKEACNARSRAWHAAHKDQAITRAAAWNKANPEKRRLSVRKCTYKKYGTTPDAVEAIFLAQGGACACCKRLTPGHKHGWQVHHLHQKGSGVVILCAKCNRGSSLFFDDPALLSRMAELNLALTVR